MSNLYVHCGLPKTGTSSLQNFLANARPQLRALGYDYPEIGTNRKKTAHHNLARELQDDPDFVPEKGSIEDFLHYLDGATNYSNIIISSEGFTHCLFKRKEAFIDFLHKMSLRAEAFTLIFTFRNFSRTAESSYLYQLTRGLLKDERDMQPPLSRAEGYLKRLFENLQILCEAFGEDRFVALDNESFGGSSITGMMGLLGVSSGLAENSARRLNEKLGLKKAAFMYRIQFRPDGSRRSEWTPRAIGKIRARISKAPELSDEIYDYRVVPYERAIAIQQAARDAMPPFLLRSLEIAASVDMPYYKSHELREVALTMSEFDQLVAVLPNHLANKIAASDIG